MIDNTTFDNKKVAFHTLGCKLNFAETSTIGKLLADRGAQPVQAGETPDICVVNTCSVTGCGARNADRNPKTVAPMHRMCRDGGDGMLCRS